MSWRRTTTLINLFSSSSQSSRRAACFVPRSYITSLQGKKDKLSITEQFETSIPRSREFEKRFFSQRSRHPPKLPRPGIDFEPDLSCIVLPEECKVKKVVQSILPSLVIVTLLTAESVKKYSGIIVDPIGYILISTEDMHSQKKEDLLKFKVVVHLNSGTCSEFSLSGEVSYVDLVNQFAIVKCKSDKRLKKMATNLNLKASVGKDVLLHVSATSVNNDSLHNSLVADAVKFICPTPHLPFRFKVLKKSIFSSSTALFDLDILVNLDGELVGFVIDCVNHFATSARVVYEVMETFKEFGNCQPWIGVDLFPDESEYMHRNCQVIKVTYGSPAQHFGLQVGDEIFRYNRWDVGSFIALYNLSLFGRGKPLLMGLIRKNGVTENKVIIPYIKRQNRTPFL